MSPHQAAIDQYLAAWNETDPGARRARVEALWAPGGATFNRVLEARGHDAIFERVTGASDKWVRDGGFVFRAAQATGFGDVVRLAWEMAARATGEVDSRAQSYLVLDRDGRILCDYQFPLQAPAGEPERDALADAYIAFWNEPDPAIRSALVKDLWAPGGGHADVHGVERGHAALLAEAENVVGAFAARGRPFRLAGPADGHHGAVRFDWTADEAGRRVASGSGLLLLDGDGLIDRAYTFDDPRPQALAAA